MTPAARLSAAIDILDRIIAGTAAEQALTNWGRASRFAGSGDRHAVRDLVFDAIRCRRSFAALGGADTGRGLILGGLRSAAVDPATLFTGEGHAPMPVEPQETPRDMSALEALDCPDWLAPALQDALGDTFAPVMTLLKQRAPVFLRVNRRKASMATAMKALAVDGVATRPADRVKDALEVTENARKIQNSSAYKSGLVELQDLASQAVVASIPLTAKARVLDYCAGGGGKSLAMAAAQELQLFAHDINPRRMRDIPERAARAGVKIALLESASVAESGPFDLVLVDAPCSGSGSWRRSPEAKWALTPERLAELCSIQAQILNETAALVAPDGRLAYATCSLLQAENQHQIDAFLQRFPDWQQDSALVLTPMDGGDGFFLAILSRVT